MSGALGKTGFDFREGPKHSVEFRILNVCSYMAVGVAESSARLDNFDEDGKHYVQRGFKGRATEGDTIKVDIDFPAQQIVFYLNGSETARQALQSNNVLYPYFSACLGASVQLCEVRVRGDHFAEL
jgi:hypothetical protein